MTAETSRELMAEYFHTMSNGGDFGRQMSEDVLWTTLETGEQTRGRPAVTDLIRALHDRMSDVQTRTFATTDKIALVEGDCLPAHRSDSGNELQEEDRIPYAVVYDIAPGRISEMRLYMQVSRLAT